MLRSTFCGDNNMTKKELIDAIIKGFGLYFLVLATLAIPGLVAGIASFVIIAYMKVNPNPALSQLAPVSSYMIQNSVNALLRFVICIGGARYFLGNPRLIHKWMRRKNCTEQSTGTDK